MNPVIVDAGGGEGARPHAVRGGNDVRSPRHRGDDGPRIAPADDDPAAPPIGVLSHTFWRDASAVTRP